MPFFKQLHPSEVLGRALFEHAPIAMLMVDHVGIVRHLNAAADELFGYAKSEMIGQSVEILLPESMRAQHVNLRATFFAAPEPRSMGAGRSLLARRKDGREFAVEIGLNPVTIGGEPIVVTTVLDISARKQAEAQANLVMRELGHRVKNTITVIGAIASRIAALSPDLTTFEREFSARLRSLSLSHDLLISEHWSGAAIHDVVETQLQFAREHGSSAFAITGPSLTLSAMASQQLGMALHELATNAIKHGALARPEGAIEVTWQIRAHSEPHLQFTWKEYVPGDPVTTTVIRRKGFGFTILQDVVPGSLDATAKLEVGSQGITWALDAPLRAVTPQDT